MHQNAGLAVPEKGFDEMQQARGIAFGIEPDQIEFAAQPGELALRQLASRGNRAGPELRGIAVPIKEVPSLAVTDCSHRRQARMQARTPGRARMRAPAPPSVPLR